jgi:hypothetical protein
MTTMTTLRSGCCVLLVLGAAACSGGAPGGDDGDDDGVGPDAGSIVEPPFQCEVGGDAGGFTFMKIATWRDDAKAAYSMIHDDMCGGGLAGIDQIAVPELFERGLVAGLGPFVQACDENSKWDVVLDAEAKGNEIISHSYGHPEVNASNMEKEICEAKVAFDAKLAHPVSFYIFPYDYFTAETVAKLAACGHLGARAGNRDDNDGFDMPPINGADDTNDLNVEFDVWPRSYSKYALYKEQNLLSVHVWNAIERGGWAVREFHSVIDDDGSLVGNGFGPIKRSDYNAHLDFLVAAWKAGLVWTTTPSTAIRYRRARKACKASLMGDRIVFDASAPDCQKFVTPISVVVATGNDVPGVGADQGGAAVPTRKIGPKLWSVTADPTRGDVVLSSCVNDGPAVDPSVMVAPKPMPEDSVCDIETVTGTGSPGKMDDLERPEEELQVLPNPSQGDGRTGTWSWYPQNVTVKMHKEGANTVLRYAGSGVNAWTGVTLAFLGGNGAGACYDAKAYKGIRFKIKGTAVSSDELNGKVMISLVTAETQSRRYGGDLKGEGGHFHKLIPVTSSWSTVTILWADFEKPTWGATTSLTTLATGKLQAIDFGQSDKTSMFELFIDDVELVE